MLAFNKLVARIAVFLICLGSFAQPTQADALLEIEQQQRALFVKIAPSVVYISTKAGTGTGFVVDKGLILTNNHVVGTGTKVDVLFRDGRRVKGNVIQRATDDVDLALVKVPITNVPELELSVAQLSVGAWIASIGHGVDSPWTFTTGMVSNIYPDKSKRPVFQTQIPLNPGNSGGPILDRSGRVVGIVTAGINSANNVNFAIHSQVAMDTLPRLGRCDCLEIRAPKKTPVFVDGRLVGKGPKILVPLTPGRHTISAVIGTNLMEKTIRYPATKSVNLTRTAKTSSEQ